jgi:DNA-directed RNA polymerase subunit RPC12/RpoP
MIHNAHEIGHPFYYNCKDCGRELCTDSARRTGLCLHCIEKRVQLALLKKPTLIVNPPPKNTIWN